MELRVSTRHVDPDITVVELAGRIKIGAEGRGVETLVKELLHQNRKKIVFDIAGVEYIDSAGMGTIAQCVSTAIQADGGLRIAGAKDKVLRLFQMTRMDTFLDCYPTVEVACQNFPSRQPGDKKLF
ncbi:MAG: STAS domain-containing protein [Acidobacteria bacterium]|nr:STAS domain-containing protein [Acidobacteriota bacterium]